MQINKNRSQTTQYLRYAIFIYLSIIFILTTWGGWYNHQTNHPWKIGDWLINYQGGFVRRGLTGEFSYILSSWTELPPSLYVFLLQTLCYSIFFLFSGLLIFKQKKIFPLTLLIFSPYIFLFQLHDFGGGYRKEIIYLAMLALYAWAATILEKNKLDKFNAIVLLCYPFAILSHEMLIIFLPYFLAIYTIHAKITARRFIVTTIFLIPSAISLLLVLVFSGTTTTDNVMAICNSLGDFAPLNCLHGGGIGWLDKSPQHSMRSVHFAIANNNLLEWSAVILPLCLIAYIPILDRIKLLLSCKLSFALILSSLAGSFALFAVAIDWGRFLYIHLVSIFILSLVIQDDCRMKNVILVDKISNYLHQMLREKNKITLAIIIIFILSYSSLWHVPHIIKNPFLSGTMARVGSALKGSL